jgi:hypothetical protein
VYLGGALNAQMKQAIRRKIDSYVNRAQVIVETVKNGPIKKKVVPDNPDIEHRILMEKFESL